MNLIYNNFYERKDNMNTDVYDTYRNDKIIGAKTLKKKFKDDRKKAIYYVKEQTGWDIEVCVDYVYYFYDNDPIFKKKEHFWLDLIKEIVDEIICWFLPHRF